MSTIALYAGKMNNMPGLVKDVRNSVKDLKSELMALKNKAQSIDRNICDLDDVISSISASTQTQENKMNTLNSLGEDVEKFALDIGRIDGKVAAKINRSKKDFYDKYSYLRPEFEKDLLERIWNKCKSGLKSAAEFCKEHWKLLTTIALVIAALVMLVILPGVTGSLAAIVLKAAEELVVKALVGGFSEGIVNCLMNGMTLNAFLEGFEKGAFEGAISGAIFGAFTGGMGSVLGDVGASVLGDIGASVMGDIGDIVIKGEDISAFDVMFNAGFAAIISGVTYPISNLKVSGINKGEGSWKHVLATQKTSSLQYGISRHLKTYLKGADVFVVEKTLDWGSELLKSVVGQWKDSWKKSWKGSNASWSISPQY